MLLRNLAKILAICSLVFILGASGAMAADKPVLTVGSSTLDEKEVLNLMATTTGGNEMMVGLMLAQSTLKDRVDLVNQMAHALLFAEAAKRRGLESRPDIAFQIKWQTMQILTQAYFEQNSAKWDMSEKAVKITMKRTKMTSIKPLPHMHGIFSPRQREMPSMQLWRSTRPRTLQRQLQNTAVIQTAQRTAETLAG